MDTLSDKIFTVVLLLLVFGVGGAMGGMVHAIYMDTPEYQQCRRVLQCTDLGATREQCDALFPDCEVGR